MSDQRSLLFLALIIQITCLRQLEDQGQLRSIREIRLFWFWFWMRDKLLHSPMSEGYSAVGLSLQIGTNSNPQIRPDYKNAAMWIGFTIPCIVSSTNAFHNYFHIFPEIQLSSHIGLFRNSINLPLVLSFPVLGFAYLINLDIAFSLWFFNLLVNMQKGLYGVFGITSGEALDTFSVSPPAIAYQEMGALIVLVVFTLWVGRGHLSDVWRKALLDVPDVDDADDAAMPLGMRRRQRE